jgi:hypothetical protein
MEAFMQAFQVMEITCGLCQTPDAKWDTRDHFECNVCGTFELSHALQIKLDGERHRGNPPLFVALSAATKQENFFRGKNLALTADNYTSYAEAHQWTTVSQKLRKVLDVAHKRSPYFGAKFELDWHLDYPLFDAISELEGLALICQLQQNGLIESAANNQTSHKISGKGWEVLEPVHAGGIPGRCFVAMAFDSIL